MEVVKMDQEKKTDLETRIGPELAQAMIARADEVPEAAKAMGLMLKEFTEQKDDSDGGQEDQTDGETLDDGGTEKSDGTTPAGDEGPMADLAKALAELPEDKRKALLEAMAGEKADRTDTEPKDVGMAEVLKAVAALSNQVTEIKSDLETVKAKGQDAPRASGFRASQDKGTADNGETGEPGTAFEDRLSHNIAQTMAGKLGMG